VVHTNAWNYVVLSTSRHRELALKAINWLNNKANDFQFASRYKSTPRWKENWGREPFTTNPYVQQYKTLLPYGVPYPKHLAFPGIGDALGIAVQSVLHDQISVADALARAERKANEEIAALK